MRFNLGTDGNPFIYIVNPDAPGTPVSAGLSDAYFQSNMEISGNSYIPTGTLLIGAGTTTRAPIRLTAGTNLTTPVAGSIEFDGTRLYITNSGNTRLTVADTTDLDDLQDQINFEGNVVKVSATGEKTQYEPSANTNIARGTALKAAVTALSAGDTLYIHGTFQLDEILTIPSDVSIIGSGWGTAIIYTTSIDVSNRANQIYLNGVNNVLLSNFKLESLATTLGYEGDGIRATGSCSNCRIERVWVAKMQNGIYLTSSSANDLGFFIHGCNITGCAYMGINIATGSEYHNISSCRINGCTSIYSDVFAVYLAGGNNIFVNCNLDDNENGIYLDSGSNHGHCNFIGGSINHATLKAVHVNNVVNGFQFIGTSIYGGDINLFACKGIQFQNCNIDATFRIDETTPKNLVGLNYITNCNVNLGTTTSILTTVGGAVSELNRSKIIVSNCQNISTGVAWSESVNLTIENPSAGSSGSLLNLYHSSASPAANDVTGTIQFTGKSSTGVTRTYAQIRQVINNTTNGIETGDLRFGVMVGGSMTDKIKVFEGIINDNSNILSIDWTNRYLTDTGGSISVDWSSQFLVTSGGTSLDWSGRYLYDASTYTSLDWQSRIVYDSGAYTSINWNNRYLYDSSGSTLALDWNNRYLYDSSGSTLALDWANRIAYDSSSFASFDWESRIAYDVDENQTLNWYTGRLSIGTGTAATKLHVFTSTATDGITIENSHAGASGGLLNIYHNSPSPAAADANGIINFSGESSTGVERIYSQIKSLINITTNAGEQGELVFSTMNLGTLTEAMRIDESSRVGIGTVNPVNKLHVYTTTIADGISLDGHNAPAFVLRSSGTIRGYSPCIATTSGQFFNDAVANDLCYRAEASKILYGVGANNSTIAIENGKVGINTYSPTTSLHVVTPTATDGITIENTNAGASGCLLDFYHNSASHAGSDVLATINFNGNNPTKRTFARVTSSISSTATSRGNIVFSVLGDNNLLDVFRIGDYGRTTISRGGGVLQQASTTLHLVTPLGFDGLTVESTSAGDTGSNINLYHNSASPAASDVTGLIQFTGKSFTGVVRTYAQIKSTIVSATNAAESSTLILSNMVGGVLTDTLQIGDQGNIGIGVAPSIYPDVKINLNGEIWNLGGNNRYLFGSSTGTYSTIGWNSSTNKMYFAGNGNVAASMTMPFVSGQVSLVGINQDSPTATLDVTCNGSNTTKVMRVQSTQSSGDAVVEDTVQHKVTTTDAATTHTNIIATATNYTYLIKTVIIARRTGGISGTAGDCASWELACQFNNISGTLTQKGTAIKTVFYQDNVATDVDLNASGTTIRFQVAGILNNNYTWHATTKIYTLST